MSSETYFAALFTEHSEVALDELMHASGLTAEEIVELVEHGVFTPISVSPARLPSSAWRFSATIIAISRRAGRLKADFDLNVSGLALALTYLERIEALEQELNRLRCNLLR
jgi:chaperone modulatory protein CbpM